MEEHEFDAAEVYVIQLNGGAPTRDWIETKEWAEAVCRVQTEDEFRPPVE